MKILDGLQYPLMGQMIAVQLECHHYPNGRVALTLVSEMEDAPGVYEPFTTLTVNLVEEDCPEGQAWIKNYAELEGCVEWMQANGLIEECPLDNCQSGHAFIERFKFSEKLLQLITDALVREGGRSRR